jgi:hypothetical protein
MDLEIEKFVIVNASPIMNVNKGCIRSLTDPLYSTPIVDLTTTYSATDFTLTFTPKETGKLFMTNIDALYFGTEGDDFIFCEDTSFQYTIIGTAQPTTVSEAYKLQ